MTVKFFISYWLCAVFEWFGPGSWNAAMPPSRSTRPSSLQHVGRIRNVVERVDADDAIDALVREIDAPAVEAQERRRGLRAGDGLAFEQLTRDVERGRGHVTHHHLAAHLREEPARPSGAGAEVEDAHPGNCVHATEDLREAAEQVRCLEAARRGLAEVVVDPVEVLAVVVLRGLAELFHGVLREQIVDVDRVGIRARRLRVDVDARRRGLRLDRGPRSRFRRRLA